MVVDYDAVVAGSKTRCPLLVEVAWLGGMPAGRPKVPSHEGDIGMVLLGVDPHKDTHTVVAVDAAGRHLDQTTVAARSHGHAQLLGWARQRWPERRVWAVEDCRHVTGAAGT